MDSFKCILVDDNIIFRKAFKNLLTNAYKAEIIGEASGYAELMEISNIEDADIVFMDLMMPEKNGIEITKELNWSHYPVRVIAITMHTDTVYLNTLIESGFKGCIFKAELFNQIHDALTMVLGGNYYFPADILFVYENRLNIDI